MRWWDALVARVGGARPVALDGVLAALVLALALAQLARPPAPGVPTRPADALGVALVVLLCAALALRSRAPVAVGVAVAVGSAAYAVLGYPQTVLGLPLAIVLYTLGSRCGLRAGRPALAAVLGTLVVSYAADRTAPDPATVGVALVSLAAAWWLGVALRQRREHQAVLEERAELLERARADHARRAVVEERLRIARELHDVVAHSMSIVAVQSGMAEHVLATDPEHAGPALAAIARSSRDALVELRRMLGVLRADGTRDAALEPVHGLPELSALAAAVRDAGLPVDLTVAGDVGRLAAGPAAAGYRIVQEALTNAVRHAGPGATVRVAVTCGPALLDVLVDDDGRGQAPPPTGTGAGLAGMRERVALYGGELAAGPRAGAGWRVHARIPLPAPDGDGPPPGGAAPPAGVGTAP